MGPEAQACDATGWMLVGNETPCLSPDTRGAEEYRLTNTCDERIDLIDAECVDGCTAALELEGHESGTLRLPSAAQTGQIAEFSYFASGEASTLRFEYVKNDCESEDVGCAIARGGDARYSAEQLLVLVLGLGFWARRSSALSHRARR
jgi:hypothetical protein